MSQTRTTAVATVVLSVCAVLVILYLGREVFVPIALAVTFAVTLRPVVQKMESWRIPAPAGTGILLVLGLLLVASIGAILVNPAKQFAAKAPQTIAAARKRLAPIQERLARLGGRAAPTPSDTTAAEKLPADSAGPDSTKADTTKADSTKTGRAKADSSTADTTNAGGGQAEGGSGSSLTPIITRVFGTTGGIVAAILETSLLLFFLLAAGDSWNKRFKAAAPSAGEASRALKVTAEIQQVVSRYLFATLLINLAQGLLVGIAMALVGMPAPILWGLFTVIAEFIPYAGGFVMVSLLALTGLAGGGGIGHALIAPGLYLAITTVQNNLVSPVVYGNRLKLNPAAILVAVMVWFFLWGVPGAFLAVPLLAAIKVLCDHIDGLAGLGKFLEG